jgi:tyrosinase
MSPEEWGKYKKAVLNLKSHGFFEDLAELHTDMDKYAHNHPRFLPWHRSFLLYFENLLQLVNKDPTLSVPYWDWTIDCEDPSKSVIFNERMWEIKEEICFELNYPKNHCLKRNSVEIDPFYNKSQVNRLINKKGTYDSFREALELVPHAVVHFNIGGKEGDFSMMWSTNDPIFWHHHSFVDLIWHRKQNKNLKFKYDGKGADLNEVLDPFGQKVKDVMSLDKLGVKYVQYMPVKIMSIGNIPGKISEEYAKRHGYNIERIREIENFMVEGKTKRSFLTRIIRFIFCIRS